MRQQIKVRRATPKDLRRIRDLAREQNERDGTSYPVPNEHLILPLVGVNQDDMVQQAYLIEAVPELCVYGCDPRVTTEVISGPDIGAVKYILSEHGYSGLKCDVPKQWEFAIGNVLESLGFKPTDHRLAHFYLQFEEKKG